jgi:hypothetical protein
VKSTDAAGQGRLDPSRAHRSREFSLH